MLHFETVDPCRLHNFMHIVKTPPFIHFLEEQLAGDLPGRSAQLKMAPVPRSKGLYPPTQELAIKSAVLILLFPEGEDWLFFLTERSHNVEHHRGQISLPGGAMEEGESFQDTALRETEEELGVDTSVIKVIGELTTLFIPVSGFEVHPIVGWSGVVPQIKPDTSEVARVYKVSLKELCRLDVIKIENRTIGGYSVTVPFFDFPNVEVWGATATILSEFREIILKILPKLHI